MIDRWIAPKLNLSISQNPAVALLGARQVGKTTLARVLAERNNSIYLDLERPSNLAKLQDPEGFFGENSGELIILDEIQRAPDLFLVLRGIIDENRHKGRNAGQFLILGSGSLALLRQSAESLAGRISYIEMNGFNLIELDENKQTIKNLWLRGGFPRSYLSNDNSRSMIWLRDLIRSYLESDVPQLGFNVSSQKLRRLWTMLAHLQGETINASKLGTNLEVSRPKINEYIDVLTGLHLVRRVEPWIKNVKKRLIKSPRYYIKDSGILHRLLGISTYDQLLSNPILGKSWEGFVIENIHSVLPPLAETYFYSTVAGAEIDLVIKMPSDDIWAVEIKYGKAPKLGKHFSQTCDDVGATSRFVVYGGEDEFPIGGGTRMISLRGILQKLARF